MTIKQDPPVAADPMAAFRVAVFADDALQARLADIGEAEPFVAAAVAIAAAHGIALAEDAVRAAIRPDPLGIGRFLGAPVTLDRWPGRGWLPARGVPTGGLPATDWAWFGETPIRDAFYEEAVRRITARPFDAMFRTRVSGAALVAGSPDAAWPPLGGFIHHMSRCGSTLVAQMLSANPRHVVLSEPEPLDAVLRWAVESSAPAAEQIAAVRAIVAALGRDRSGDTERVFVKLDSWHVLALPLLRAAFPDVPWIYLYREPVEVLVSQSRARGIHTIPGALPASLVAVPGAETMDPERYAATVLALTNAAALEHLPLGGGLLVDYRELPGAIDQIAEHFGWQPDADERAAMAAVAERDVRAPEQRFTGDSAAKRQAATAAILAAAAVADPAHAALVAARSRRE